MARRAGSGSRGGRGYWPRGRFGDRAEQAWGAARKPCEVVATPLATQTPPQARLLRPEAPRGIGGRFHLLMPALPWGAGGPGYLPGPKGEWSRKN